jgi:hypothetical protein
MTEDGKKAALQQITTDLEGYVADHCARSTGKASDFADEKCNDAALMLREALDNLEAAG